MSDAIVGAVVGGATSSLLDAFLGGRREKAREERAALRKAAKLLLSWITPMKSELFHARDRREIGRWPALVQRAYDSITAVRWVAPHDWRHLRRSLRDCLGNGIGALSLVDLEDWVRTEPVDFDGRWTNYAAEYLAYLETTVQRWKHTRSSRVAGRIGLLTFGEWLRRTDRRPI